MRRAARSFDLLEAKEERLHKGALSARTELMIRIKAIKSDLSLLIQSSLRGRQ